MRLTKRSGGAAIASLFWILLWATALRAESKQHFEFTVDGDWPVKELEGESAWAYDMAGFFHIGLDGKANKQWIVLDINKKGIGRPSVGTHPIGSSNLSGFMATLEVRGDDKSTVRSGSGELEILKVGPEGIEGTFHFKSTTLFGGPELSVTGKFVAKERPKKKK